MQRNCARSCHRDVGVTTNSFIKGILRKERESRQNNLIKSLLKIGLESKAKQSASILIKNNSLSPEVADMLKCPISVPTWRSMWTPFVPDRNKIYDELGEVQSDFEKWSRKNENCVARLRLQRVRERLLHEAESGLDSLREYLRKHPTWKIFARMTWKPDTCLPIDVDKNVNIRIIKRQIQEREGVDSAVLHCYICKNSDLVKDDKTFQLPSATFESSAQVMIIPNENGTFFAETKIGRESKTLLRQGLCSTTCHCVTTTRLALLS